MNGAFDLKILFKFVFEFYDKVILNLIHKVLWDLKKN